MAVDRPKRIEDVTIENFYNAKEWDGEKVYVVEYWDPDPGGSISAWASTDEQHARMVAVQTSAEQGADVWITVVPLLRPV